jgi:hypothetical protein
MPLQNRVTPFADLIACAARGLFMGNRGGRIHDGARKLSRRRWASKAWICCRLEFKNRHRAVWSDSYTELFFLDEPTALAAGHRPCFECRRADAVAFATAWTRAHGGGGRPSAPHMDSVLHDERLAGRAKRLHLPATSLPDGTFVTLAGEPDLAHAIRGGRLLRWSHDGYVASHALADASIAAVITPPATVAALAQGYAPQWHPSAG